MNAPSYPTPRSSKAGQSPAARFGSGFASPPGTAGGGAGRSDGVSPPPLAASNGTSVALNAKHAPTSKADCSHCLRIICFIAP
ncbi:MAG: hypothetical protein HS116_12090 [Planctomycetes bacterium]|nr:hypothetical protein [Planctomycetota bacterium]